LKRILMVDDSPTVLSFEKLMFRHLAERVPIPCSARWRRPPSKSRYCIGQASCTGTSNPRT
jgi:hypothetical protein